MGTMDEIEVVLRRFGDEQSTLLDRFERLSFEVQLNQAILGRSLSEPCVPRTRVAPPPPVAEVEHRRRHASSFQKVLKKLIKPILRRKGARKETPEPKNLRSWKAFSRSLRL